MFEPIKILSPIQPEKVAWATNRKSRFDAKINVHTGKPHKHEREIARRLRQQNGGAA